jgi:hypothetical protein
MSSIFIAMPSLPDTGLLNTINSAFDNSRNPDDIYFGIHFTYSDNKDLEYVKKNISNSKNIILIEKKISKNNNRNKGKIGTGVSRCGSSSLYNGQDYFFQTDSHMLFDTDWDKYLIELHSEAKSVAKNDKVVLTGYPGPHIYEETGIYRNRKPKYPKFLRNYILYETLPGWVDSEIVGRDEKFLPAIKTSGSFIFGDKNFAKNTGLEQYIHFLDEELIQTMNLIWEGFSLVFPNIEDLPITHMYNQDINKFGGERKNAGDFCNLETFGDISKKSYLKYLLENPEKADKYYKYSSVHPRLGSLKNGQIPEVFNN